MARIKNVTIRNKEYGTTIRIIKVIPAIDPPEDGEEPALLSVYGHYSNADGRPNGKTWLQLDARANREWEVVPDEHE